MLRRDYIQRMIDEFARVVAHALGLKSSARNGEAIEELRNAYSTWFALDADTLDTLSPEALVKQLSADENFPLEKIGALAYGLKAECELHSPADPKRTIRREQALALFLYLETADAITFSFTRKAAIAALQQLQPE